MDLCCIQLTWHYRGLLLQLAIYPQVCVCLRDSHESVRLVAVKLLWAFSQIFPERFEIALL